MLTTPGLPPPSLPSFPSLPHLNFVLFAGRWSDRHMPEQVTTCEVAQCEGSSAKTRKVDRSTSDEHKAAMFVSVPLTDSRAWGLCRMVCRQPVKMVCRHEQSLDMHFNRRTLWSDPGTTRAHTRQLAPTDPKMDTESARLMISASDTWTRALTPHSSVGYASADDDGPLIQDVGQKIDRMYRSSMCRLAFWEMEQAALDTATVLSGGMVV